nr:hypothetical protein GCM10020092_014050 [Actinoplanes digitatis]
MESSADRYVEDVASSVYVAGLGPGVGKSTVALGLAELLSRQVARIGVFRPLTADPGADPLLTLLTTRYPVVAPYAESFGVTVAEAATLVADGRREELISRIVERYRAVERQCGSVIVIGSDFSDGQDDGHDELPRELAFNARLATEFGSVVIPVVAGQGRRPDLNATVRSAYHTLVDLDATVLAVIANRVPPGMATPGGLPVPVWAIPEVPAVAAPTVAEVAAALDATVVTGGEAALDRDVLDYVVGAAHVPSPARPPDRRRADHHPPGDRADLLVAASAAHAAGSVTLAGLVLTLGELPDPRAVRLIERLNTGLAMLVVRSDSYQTISAANRIEAKLSVGTPRKVEAALGAFETHVDTTELNRLLDVTRSSRVTP